jgi:cupin 2 domain-containing protein
LQPAGNLFTGIPETIPQEIIEILLKTPAFHLERIVSAGQATPPGQWYDQETHEWVLLLSGAAGLLFEGDAEVRELRPGDYLLIPAHCRHRVEWTDPRQNTVWLALHYQPGKMPGTPGLACPSPKS